MLPALVILLAAASALNLEYLDPTKLQTKTSPEIQQNAAINIINRYNKGLLVQVKVDPLLFQNNKDAFTIRTDNNPHPAGSLHIDASSGVAAVWGFNYFLKKYCNSQISWQQKHVVIPRNIPAVDETVVANDRFRYYQNVCTASYSAVWWGAEDWEAHVAWMALNGINLALAPVAQEAAWARVYRALGLTDDELDQHFTGPAFLAWLRMGNVRGWGGPLPASWHASQHAVQAAVLPLMLQLGMVPVLPAFSGHVPRALSRLYPNANHYTVGTWNNFADDYCCGLFLDPNDPLFKTIGQMFWKEITTDIETGHIYTADPFNEVEIEPWSTALVAQTSRAIFNSVSEMDSRAVLLVQNWMFVHDPILWPKKRVQAFITAVPNGRMLLLDLQAEQWPMYEKYDMYFGQPFVWCMLHNFGGTLGMFGNTRAITGQVHAARALDDSTMVGVGLTPEGINQNYVVYDLMLEASWRAQPVRDLPAWAADYALRRYGCNATATAWRYLMKSVYDFDGLNRMRGKYVITRRPSFKIIPWAWYKSHDLFEAWRRFVYDGTNHCNTQGFLHDLVDVTRQALQYRAEQIYMNLLRDRFSNTMVFNATINQFLDVMSDMELILATHVDFTVENWIPKAQSFGRSDEEVYLYELNARNQITLWGPNGEITDYACKQWAEMFHYYYIPRWRAFLAAALDAKDRGQTFDERGAQNMVRATVERRFATVSIEVLPRGDPVQVARGLFSKWAKVPGLSDLPITVIKPDGGGTTLPDTDLDGDDATRPDPTVLMMLTTSHLYFY